MSLPLDLDQLRTFCAIADCGSFTGASRRVNKTQPAVSVQIKRLEERLGNTLFLRTSRGISLTNEGDLLYARARRMLQLNAEIVDLMADGPLGGTVRFGVPNDYASLFLPMVLSSFNQTHPRILVEVTCQNSVSLIDGMRNGAFDVIAFTQGVQQEYGEMLRVERLVWVASEGGRALAADPLPLVCAGPDCAWRQDAMGQLKRMGRAIRIAYSTTDANVTAGVVMADLAVGFMPECAVTSGMRMVTEDEGLPRLLDVQLALLRGAHAYGGIFDALVEHIFEAAGNLSPDHREATKSLTGPMSRRLDETGRNLRNEMIPATTN